MAAMALVYGWAVFGDQLTDAFGYNDRADIDARLGALASQLAVSAGGDGAAVVSR